MFFNRKPENINQTALRHEIDRLFVDMAKIPDRSSAEYKEMSARLKELYPLREVDSTIADKKWLSPEIMLPIIANLVGVVLVINHEQTAVITSKAFDMVRKPK